MKNTKASLVMVHLAVAPADMPPAEQDVIRRFLYDNVRGVDEAHTKRWRRAVRRLVDGEVMQFYPLVDRSGQFHKRHMALERRIFENQDRWEHHELPKFREWLKTGAGFGHFERDARGHLKFTPASTKYEEASDDEMKEFHANAMAFLHTPKALQKLWPHLKPALRLEMLETLLKKPQPEEQTA